MFTTIPFSREPCKIYVTKIPDGTEKEELIAFFSANGNLTVKDVLIKKPRHGFTSGYGFITFSTDLESIQAVQQFDNSIFYNNQGNSNLLSVAPSTNNSKYNLAVNNGRNTELPQSSAFSPSSSNLPSPMPKLEDNTLLALEQRQQHSRIPGRKTQGQLAYGPSEAQTEYFERKENWSSERQYLIDKINDNQMKIDAIPKFDQSEDALDVKERRLTKEKEELERKIVEIQDQIDVIKLKKKLRDLKFEQQQLQSM